MKFNTLAKKLDLTVGELADKVSHLLPNANGGTEVSEALETEITAFIKAPVPESSSAPALFSTDGTDPILAVLTERIESELQLETPEQLVDHMVERYLEAPNDLPTAPYYKAGIVTFVDLVKKRHARRHQQSLKLRSLLNRQSTAPSAAEPSALDRFYAAAPSSNVPAEQLDGNGESPQLTAASS